MPWRPNRTKFPWRYVVTLAGGGAVIFVAFVLIDVRRPERRARQLRVQADLHAQLGQFEESERALMAALELAPDDVPAAVRLARVLAAQGRATEAIAHLERLRRERPNDPMLAVALAELFLARGQAIEAALVLRPELGTLRSLHDPLERGRALLTAGRAAAGMGALAEAEGLFVAAARVGASPVTSVAQLASEALLSLADLLTRSGRLEEAEQVLLAAREYTPWDPRIAVAMSVTLQLRGEVERAIQELEPLTYGPRHDPIAALALGNLLTRDGRTDDALALASRSDTAHDDQTAAQVRAAVGIARGEVAAVNSVARDLAQHTHGSPLPRLLMGRAALSAGDVVRSKGEYEAALLLDASSLEAELALLDIHERLDDLPAMRTRAVGLLSRADARAAALNALLLVADDHLPTLDSALQALPPSEADVRARTARGLLLLARGAAPEASVALDPFLAAPDHASAAAMLGDSPADIGRMVESIELLACRSDELPAIARLLLARVLDRLGRPALALRTLPNEPGVEDAILHARLCVLTGDTEAGIAGLTRIVQGQPDSAGLLAALAELHLGKGEFERAAGLLTDAAERRPEGALIRARLGRTKAALGETSRALEEFANARRLDAALPFAYEDGLLRLGSDPAAASSRFAEGLAATGDPRLAAALAASEMLAGRTSEALAALQRCCPAGPTSPETEVLWAMISGLANQPDTDRTTGLAPLVILRAARATRDPYQASVKTSLELFALCVLGWTDRAEAIARKVAETPSPDLLLSWWARRALLRPGADSARQKLAFHLFTATGGEPSLGLDHAEAQGERGERAEQRRTLLDLAKSPLSASHTLVDIGMMLEEVGERAVAEQCYRKALSSVPEDVQARNNLACVLSADPARREEALEHARAAARRAPTSPEVQDTLGWLLHLRGDPNALEYLRWALSRRPDDPTIRFHAAAAFGALGQRRRAAQHLQLALTHTDWAASGEARALLAALQGANGAPGRGR